MIEMDGDDLAERDMNEPLPKESSENENSEGSKDSRKRPSGPKNSAENNLPSKRKRGNTRDNFRKPPIAQLKKTGESFLQDCPCFEIPNKLNKCRECRASNQAVKNSADIFCRFYAFRKLRYTKFGLLAIAGFSDPLKDPAEDDLKLWMPNIENPPVDLDFPQARFLLAQVADQFCDLLVQENLAVQEYMPDGVNKVVAWKRAVKGVREMCDVCETHLFNYHWTCAKCGFVVCIDCHKARKSGEIKIWNETFRDRDEFFWLTCVNMGPHEHDRLMLTQIIAGESLEILGKQIHEVRAVLGIPQNCGCPMSKESPAPELLQSYNDFISPVKKMVQENGSEIKNVEIKSENDHKPKTRNIEETSTDKDDHSSALSWLADVALQKEGNDKSRENSMLDIPDDDFSDCSSSEDDEGDPTLRAHLINSSNKPRNNVANIIKPPKKSRERAFEEILVNSLEEKPKESNDESELSSPELLVSNGPRNSRYLPIRIMTLTASHQLYPGVPHSWLCDGKLLRLLDPLNPGNIQIFQEQWKRGQPVIVSEVSSFLNMDLWRPEAFSKDFGEDANDLVNCMTGTLVPNQPMKRFWDGFDYINKRIKDDHGTPMLLKLKDWPPGEDFAEILPTRFNDLMKCLPLGDYTKRDGKFNLASRLPDIFVRPDLGPKMYNAYGSALHPTKGTTNLHLDISDAVNVMVYVGIPKDTGTDDSHIREAYRAIDEAGCDILTRRRVREGNELPGALWHIFAPRDADKIRDLLNKISIERGERLEHNHDAIHDQSWYLDGPLRERLYKEYGVEGYPIAQCLGDAVFIPAGAPHQVRNLHNCVKVAEDFVSPENVSECFHLTHEFRALSDTHSNHEDKLQIKNIIYHAVKDALSVLSHKLGHGHTAKDSQEEKNIKTEIKDEIDE